MSKSMNENTKIVLGIERLSTLFRAALWDEAKQCGLSPLQVQIMLFIASHTQTLNNVSCLAKEFGVTKATVSDAVRTLLGKKLLKKQSGDDARAFSLHLTAGGHKQLQELASLTKRFDETLSLIPESERERIWEGLLLLIGHLQKTGVIPLRICFSCQHFEKRKGVPYCNLLQQSLHLEDIRLDCQEHLLAA